MADTTAAGRWDWEPSERQDSPRDDADKGSQSNGIPMRRIVRALGLHRLSISARKSSRAERDSSVVATHQSQSQSTTTELVIRTTDRLGDQAAARYCHFRRFVETLDDERLDHTLFSLLMSAEGARDELRVYEEETTALVRLAQTGHFVRQLRRLHGVLDVATTSYGVNEPPDLTEWRAALTIERDERVERYNILLAELRRDSVQSIDDGDGKKSTPALLIELESEAQREEVMVLLKYALDKYGDELTSEEAETVTEAFRLVAEIFGMAVMALPPWFTPVFEFGSTFGLSRWGNDLLTVDHTDQSRFIRDVSVWASLNHPHVAKFLGACHVGSRWFIALEKLRPLREYAVEALDRKFVWRRLYEVALSLQYLHERGLACTRLDMESVFCAQLEDKAVLRGVDFIPLRDGSSVSRQPQLFARNMFDLGLVILNSLLALNGSKQRFSGPVRRRSKMSSPENDHYQTIPRQCPAHILEPEWQILERLRSFNVDSPSARLEIIHGMREFGDFDQHHWLGMQWLDLALDRSSGDVNIGLVKVPRHEKSIAAILSECSEMSTSEPLSHRVYQRLADVYSQLREAARTQQRAISSSLREAIVHFVILLTRLYDFLRSRLVDSNAASWVSLSYSHASVAVCTRRKDPAMIFSLHIGIDRLLKQHHLDNSDRVHAWQPQWERVCNSLQSVSLSTLLHLPDGSADGIGANHLISVANTEDIQALVAFELGQYASAAASQQLDAVPNSHIPRVKLPRWFVPPSEIDIQLDVELGRGSFGAVYFGRWFDTPVVVKRVFIDQATKALVRKQFRHEADVWFRLNHINIVKMYGACQVGDPIFVCEFASGGNLDSYLRLKGQNAYLIWYSLLNAALGLQYLRDNGVVHGDLKANNLLVGADGVVKLADFGLSVSVRDGGSASEGGALGAYRWKAPECLQGQFATFASDVFSFAMVMIEIVSGSVPWGQLNDGVVKVHAIRGELPTRDFEIGDAEWRLIQAMCCRDPSERVTIDAVVVHLSSLLERLDINDVVSMLGRKAWTKSVKNHVVSRDGALLGVMSLAKSKNTRLSDFASYHLMAVHLSRDRRSSTAEINEILNLISSAEDAQKEWAITSIGNLSLNLINSAGIATSGAIERIVEILKEGTTHQKELATSALANFARDLDSSTSIAAAGAIPPLVRLLCIGTDRQKVLAADAVAVLAADSTNSVAISATDGAVAALVDLLQNGEHSQKVEAAAFALRNLSMESDNQAQMTSAGAIFPLVTALRCGSDDQKSNVAAALRNLSASPENMVVVAAAGAIQPLVTLLKNGTDDHKEQAGGALANLAVNSSNRISIAEAGAIEPLVVLLGTGTEGQKDRAAMTLSNLAMNENNKALIAAAGAIKLFVALLSTGTDVQRDRAAGALRNLAWNADNKAAIVDAGGIAPLVSLVRDGSNSQKDKAAAALANISTIRKHAVSIMEAGGIGPLETLWRDGTPGQQVKAEAVLENLGVIRNGVSLMCLNFN